MAPIPISLPHPIPPSSPSNFAIPLSAARDLLSPITTIARRVVTPDTYSRSVHLTLRARAAQLLTSRQSNGNVVPATYGSINSGPPSGTVVGIVLGSVGGFLVVLFLIYSCLNLSSSSTSSYSSSVVVRARRKSHASRSRRTSETVQIRRERSPVRVVREPERVERVVVEERRETRRERSPSAGSDEVVVIEEHSPPRRTKSKRVEVERETRSGFRTVDPQAYGGVVGGNSRRSSGGR